MRHLWIILLVLSILNVGTSYGESDGSVTLPSAPAPVNPANDDGAEKDRKAQNAAAAGAAMAALMCQMLMRQAMKEIDPAKKQMLMMMAMQQCNQAAQSANAANENGKAKQKLTQNDTPKGLQIPPFKAPEATKDTELLKNPNVSDDSPLDSGIDLPTANNANTSPDEPAKSAEFAFESKSQLNPIENPSLTFQENSKSGGAQANSGTSGSPAILSVGAAKNLSSEELRALIAEGGSGKITKRAVSAESGEGQAVAPIAAGSSSSGESKDFDSMLASLMGGGGQVLESGAASQDVLAFGETEKLNNIFQYANYRYQQAADQKRLVAGKKRLPAQIVE